jgi:hypothetical protein
LPNRSHERKIARSVRHQRHNSHPNFIESDLARNTWWIAVVSKTGAIAIDPVPERKQSGDQSPGQPIQTANCQGDSDHRFCCLDPMALWSG